MATRNPVAKFNRTVNRPQIEKDKTKYKRTQRQSKEFQDDKDS